MPESTPAQPAAAPDEQATNIMVRRLALVVFLEWLGAGAIIPLFPWYLKHHGASPSLIGLTMSAFFLAGLVTQFPAGRLADRIGRRPVLIGGLMLYAAAAIPVLTSSTIKSHDIVHSSHEPLVRLVMSRALLGAVFGALALGLGIGVYEACWTLLLHDRGGSSLIIALSWTAFSVPYVFFVRAAGWFADHWDRRMLAAVGLLVSVGFCMAYPFVTSIPILLAMGFLESVGFSFALPSLQAMMTESRTPRELGRVQGVYASSQTGAIALSSAVAGVLFGMHQFLPFIVSGGIGLLLTVALLIAWAPLDGHAHHSVPPEALS